jgi:hypothetical protein
MPTASTPWADIGVGVASVLAAVGATYAGMKRYFSAKPCPASKSMCTVHPEFEKKVDASFEHLEKKIDEMTDTLHGRVDRIFEILLERKG